MKLNENIEHIKNLMNNTLNDISSLISLNFDEKFNSAKHNMELINSIKVDLKKTYSVEDLRKHEGELIILSDKIDKKYSTVIQDFIKEKEYIATELSRTSNKKRLEFYKR